MCPVLVFSQFTNAAGWLPTLSPQARESAGRRAGNLALRNLEGAYPVIIQNPAEVETRAIGRPHGIIRVAGIADIHEVDSESIAPAAKDIGFRRNRGERQHSG